jgi:hypothetical protein
MTEILRGRSVVGCIEIEVAEIFPPPLYYQPEINSCRRRCYEMKGRAERTYDGSNICVLSAKFERNTEGRADQLYAVIS